MQRIVACILFSVSAVLPLRTDAQVAHRIGLGELVRVTAPASNTLDREMRFISLENGLLTLANDRSDGARVTIRADQVTRLEVRRPSERRLTGKGIGIGAGVGALLFGVGGYLGTRCPDHCDNEYLNGAGGLLALPGSAVGALVGGIIGHNTRAVDWTPLSIPLRMGADTRPKVRVEYLPTTRGISASLRF